MKSRSIGIGLDGGGEEEEEGFDRLREKDSDQSKELIDPKRGLLDTDKLGLNTIIWVAYLRSTVDLGGLRKPQSKGSSHHHNLAAR